MPVNASIGPRREMSRRGFLHAALGQTGAAQLLHLSGREGGAIQRQQGGEELLRWIPRCTRSVCEGIHCPPVLCEIHVYPSFLFQMAGLRFKCPHIK